MNKKTKILFIIVSIVYAASLVLFAISFSINLPIYFRPFYYALIKPLNIVNDLNKETGGSYTYKDVVEAYNEVLNFCCFNTKFGTGKLAWSEDGMNHFKDCQGLFLLDTIIMFVSGLSIGGVHLLKKFKIVEPYKHSHLISGITAMALPATVGLLASINFEKAFEVFHHIFFPGKENWLFDQNTDQVILIMPMNFFMACAILIGISIVGICTYYIVRNVRLIQKEKRSS